MGKHIKKPRLGLRKKMAYVGAFLAELSFKFEQRGSPDYLPSVTRTGKWFLEGEISIRSDCITESQLHEADLCLIHKFDILGTGLTNWGQQISWHKDVGSGRWWPLKFHKKMHNNLSGVGGSDVKIPWELSRFQQVVLLGKAYLGTGDEKYAKEAISQIDDWITKNPFRYGVNWICAMEVAIRSCNWIWAWFFFSGTSVWNMDFQGRFLKALWQHGCFIEQNLENKGGILTNHYLANVSGLLFLGVMFPEFRFSERWREFSSVEIVKCMDQMVYEDGVSYENSTSYHRLVLEFFAFSAILCEKNNIFLPVEFWERLEKMFEFIMYGMRPDGRMPMIGDSDDGRFFAFSSFYYWEPWDFSGLLAIGAILFRRRDFKDCSNVWRDECFWLFGDHGRLVWEGL